MGDRAVLSKNGFLTFLFSILRICFSGISLGIFLWVERFEFFRFRLPNNQPLGLWIVPENLSLSKYILISVSIYLLFWLIYSFALSVIKDKKLNDILNQDAQTYLPSLFLLLSLLQFFPKPAGLKDFGVFLSQYVSGVLIMTSIAGIIFLKCRMFKSISKKNVLPSKLLALIAELNQKKIKWIVFIVSLVVYLVFTLHILSLDPQDERKYYLLTGDEPQYLLITHSLVFDRDFNLFNNQLQEDWKYFEERPIDGHALGFEYFDQFAKGKLRPKEELWKNRRYSVHRIGLPLALGPVYFTGVKWNLRVRLAVMLFLNFCAALVAVNIYSLGLEVTKDRWSALAAWLFLSFTAPILFYSNKIFPDAVAGLIIIFAFRKIKNLDGGNFFKFILIGLSIGFLPWLHERFILTSIILFGYFMFKVRFSPRIISILALPIIISVILQAAYYNLLFGVPYPVNTHPFLSFGYGVKHGLPGLLFDQNQGLLLYSPVYVLVFTGILLWFKDKAKDRDWLWLGLIVVSNYILTGIFRDWTGGLAPPTRYIMPIAPLLAAPIAYSLYKIKDAAFRFISIWLAATGILISGYGMWHPGLLYRYTHPLIPLLNKYINFKIIFPDFLKINSLSYSLFFFWLLIVFAFCLYYTYQDFWKGNVFRSLTHHHT